MMLSMNVVVVTQVRTLHTLAHHDAMFHLSVDSVPVRAMTSVTSLTQYLIGYLVVFF